MEVIVLNQHMMPSQVNSYLLNQIESKCYGDGACDLDKH